MASLLNETIKVSLYQACYNGSVAEATAIYNNDIKRIYVNNIDGKLTHELMPEQQHLELVNCGLDGACEGNQVETAKLMISKGATNFMNCMFVALNATNNIDRVNLVVLLYNHGASAPNYMFQYLIFTEEFIVKLFENQMPRDCFAKMQISHDPSVNNVLAKMNALQTEICKHQDFLPLVLLQLVSNCLVV